MTENETELKEALAYKENAETRLAEIMEKFKVLAQRGEGEGSFLEDQIKQTPLRHVVNTCSSIINLWLPLLSQNFAEAKLAIEESLANLNKYYEWIVGDKEQNMEVETRRIIIGESLETVKDYVAKKV